jgi:hypothetical protein
MIVILLALHLLVVLVAGFCGYWIGRIDGFNDATRDL